MIKIKDLTLEELYNKPKATPSIEAAIVAKEDFRQIQPAYCEKICKLKCKSYGNVELDHGPVDVLIIQDHDALNDGWKEAAKVEKAHRNIIAELCRRNLQGLTYRLTNLFKCQITDEDTIRGNKPPSSSVLTKCSPYLKKEIELSKPKVIICLGTVATKALGLKKSNYTNRGEIHSNIVLTLHPKVTLMIRQNSSGRLWGIDYWDVIDRDFRKAGKIARKEIRIPSLQEGLEKYKPNIFVARSLKDVEIAIAELLSLSQSKIVSFDTETTGLDPWHKDAKLLTIQFGYKHSKGYMRSIVIPLWHRDNKAYNANEAWTNVSYYLRQGHPKIGHHVKFDILYIYATTGVRVCNVVFDTMLVLHNLNSGIQGSYGLKGAVWDYLPQSGLGGYEDQLPKLTKEEDLEEDDVYA
jgi:uracil-DNA glycosylase family 4